MKSPAKSVKLSLRAVLLTLTLACIVVGIVEVQVLEAKERAENPPQVLDGNTCFKCHYSPDDLARLRRKEGGSGFLFNADGSPHNPKIVEYYRKQGFTYEKQDPTLSYHSGIHALPASPSPTDVRQKSK